jgi:hypothetical protein
MLIDETGALGLELQVFDLVALREPAEQAFAELGDRRARCLLADCLRRGDLAIRGAADSLLEDPARLVLAVVEPSLDVLDLSSKSQGLTHVDRRTTVKMGLVADEVRVAHASQLSTHDVVRAPADPKRDAVGLGLLTSAQSTQHLEQRRLYDGVDLVRVIEVPAGPLACGLTKTTRHGRVACEEAAVVEQHDANATRPRGAALVDGSRAVLSAARNSTRAASGQRFLLPVVRDIFRIWITVGQGSGRRAAAGERRRLRRSRGCTTAQTRAWLIAEWMHAELFVGHGGVCA